MVKPIKLLALDIDGVLTDGRETLGVAASRKKTICFHDLDAVAAFRRAGHHVALVTGEDNEMVAQIAGRFGTPPIRQGAKDKVAALRSVARELKCSLKETCYVGDSDRDAPALALVGLGLAPANATPTARYAAHRVLNAKGGEGVAAEAVRLLFHRGKIQLLVQGFPANLRRRLMGKFKGATGFLEKSLPHYAWAAAEVAHALTEGRKVLLLADGPAAPRARALAWRLAGWDRHSRPALPVFVLPWPKPEPRDGHRLATAGVLTRQVQAFAQPGDVVVAFGVFSDSSFLGAGLKAAQKVGAVTMGFTPKEQNFAAWRAIGDLAISAAGKAIK